MKRRKLGAGTVALCGVLSAGAVAVLFLACIAPSGRVGFAAVAGLFPLSAMLSLGQGAGYLCWIASGLLALLLLPDKGLALLYLVFLGVYPVLKGQVESLRKLPLEVVIKLAFFNLVLFGISHFVWSALFPSTPEFLFGREWLIYPIGNAVFLAYDYGLTHLISTLVARWGKRCGI